MSRLGRTCAMSHENLPPQQATATQEKGNTTARSEAPPLGRIAALNDISSVVSNAASTNSLGGRVAEVAARAAGLTRANSLAGTSVAQSTASTRSLAPHAGGAAAMELEESARNPALSRELGAAAATGGDNSGGLDAADASNPQMVVEYVADIMQHYRQEEERYLIQPDYMKRQGDVNEKMRGILVDWLVEVHLKYKLKPETLYLAVHVIDRYLEKKQISRKRLQLVGVTGMLIASKYEEIYAPEIRDFVYTTDKAYTREDIIQMEIQMLNTLEFQMTAPTPVNFLERFMRLHKCDEAHKDLARYVMELTLLDVTFLRYSPSHLAAAALFLSNKLMRHHPSWPALLIRHTRYTEPDFKGCAKQMCALLEGVERSSLAAVRKKYALQKFHGVSKMQW